MAKTLDIQSLSALFPKSSDYTQDYGWVAIVGVVLLGFGQEPRVKELGEAILQQTENDEKAQITAYRKLREALLKASPLVGFPRVCVRPLFKNSASNGMVVRVSTALLYSKNSWTIRFLKSPKTWSPTNL